MGAQTKLVIKESQATDFEIISAWLSVWGADAILYLDESLEVFFSDTPYKEIIDKLQTQLDLDSNLISLVEVEDKNWNAEWEANFEPIVISNLYVRAYFHEPNTEGLNELIIAPKMAFGTGHHETTYMMLDYLQSLDLTGKNVLDYGCGTGILAVYAAIKGSKKITGIDIQEEAIENTIEHIELNQQNRQSFQLHIGDLDVLDNDKYDLVLANINRHILLERDEALYNLTSENGQLLISGILKSDRDLIIDKYVDAGYKLESKNSRGEWCLFVFSKS